MEKLTLLLSPEQANDHCRTLVTQTRHAGQALAALVALQSFIAATVQPNQHTDSIYQDIKLILEQHIATARNRVMEDNLARLLGALDEQNLGEIQSVHAALSRNGFHQTVLSAIPRLSVAALLAAAGWTAEWHREARTRAEAASPYPDALDLRGAGISPPRFAAMSELNIYLQEALFRINPNDTLTVRA
jgi:hypothetical protein